jgi:RNA polymerase sigma-70 factor (ECF subfamily)
MKAALSGRAAAALVIDGDAWYRIDGDRLEELKPSGPHEWPYVFGLCQDVQYLDVVSYTEVRAALAAAVDQEHALSLALICLDTETRSETRQLAADDLEKILTRTPDAIEFLWKVFSSKPLPSTASLERALGVTRGAVQGFFDRLGDHQEAIAVVRRAWELLPEEIFSGVNADEVFSFAVHAGICTDFVGAVRHSHPAQIADVEIPGQWRSSDIRRILSEWLASTRWNVVPETPILRGLSPDETTVYPTTRANEAVRGTEALENLYGYYPGVLVLLRRLGFSPDEAEDLAQESFVRVFTHMKDYRGDAQWAYLEKTVRRVAANAIRAKSAARRHGETVSDEVLATVPDSNVPLPDASLAQTDVVNRVREAIAQLDPIDQTVLLLRLNGRSYDEIVEALGISMSAVKSRLNTARRRLKELLGEDH